MSDVFAQQLEAGGYVPVDADIPADIPTDTVDARAYTHSAIPGRTVVRLVPDAIARGVDTEMGLFGFAMTGHHDDIARQRRRTLGFPGSTLVSDPERARYALDVMKEFRAQAKRVSSKPGFARDGFDAIAERLARQVPHFLPSFYEEVGRSFASAGNFAYAAGAFDKARGAEQKYGLKVDEERRGEAFLEFALLGALTVKSLQAYGKELAKSVGGEVAYERMFALAVRRTLGGLPPWASLPKDLRSLVKGAKRDVATEDQRFLREVLGGSAIARAPSSFWDEYAPALRALAASDPAIRARMLDLFPNGGKTRYSWRNEADTFSPGWMELLHASGALDALWDRGAPAEALPSGGRAAWFGRYQDWASSGDGWILQLLRRSAPALVADGAPIPVQSGGWYNPLDLDLLDLVLELGLDWTSEGSYRVELAKWAQWTPAPARDGFPEEHRPRDPVRAVADPKVAALLGPAVDAAFGDAHFEEISARMTALQPLRREWLDRQIADLDASGIGTTSTALGRLEAATSASHFAEFPAAVEALAASSVARALHRTLVTGIFDELGWPAYDTVMADIGAKPDEDIHVNRQWPYLIIGKNRKMHVLGPKGLELSHDLKVPKDVIPSQTAFVGGQLYVAWSRWTGTTSESKAYWSAAPSDTFDVDRVYGGQASAPIVHPDAIVLGIQRFGAGDRTPPPEGVQQFHDATGAWVWTSDGCRVQDRATGKPGEKGAPSFLATVFDRQGSSEVSYYPVPPEIASTSPMPVADGQYGSRVLRPVAVATDAPADADDFDEDESPGSDDIVFETLTGDRAVGSFRNGGVHYLPGALVRWPGAPGHRAVTEQQQWWRNAHNPQFYLADPDRPNLTLLHDSTLRTAHAWLPSLAYWHYLVPRDPGGSAALRALAGDRVAELLETAVAEEETFRGKLPGAADDERPTLAAVRRLLPEITNDVLRQGVVGVVRLAGNLEARLRKLREERKGGVVTVPVADGVLDGAITESVSGLRRYYTYGGGRSVTAAIRSLGAFLVGGETATDVLFCNVEVQEWLGRIRALAWCATRPGLAPTDRDPLLAVLRTWAGSGLADDAHLRIGRLRIDELEKWVATKVDEGFTVPTAGWRFWNADRRIVTWGCSEDEEGPWEASFAEWSRDGVWQELPGTVVTQQRVIGQSGERSWLEAFCDAAPARGARPMSPAMAEQMAEQTGMSTAEAGVVLATFPTEMDKETREVLGLKANELKASVRQFYGWDVDRKLDLLTAAAPSEPLQLWSEDPSDPESPTARLTAAWLARFGKAVPVSADLLALADKELSGRNGATHVKRVANPGTWKELDVDVKWDVGPGGDVVVAGTPSGADEPDEGEPSSAGFDGAAASIAAEVLAWLVVKLPVGHPLRANVAMVYEKVVERLKNPTLLLFGGQWYLGDPKSNKAGAAFFDALGGELLDTVKSDDTGEVSGWQRRAGPLVATRNSWSIRLVFRPNGLDPSSRELLSTFARASGSQLDQLHAWELLQSDAYATLMRRATGTPLAEGEWEQNPARSAPEVVTAVAETHALSEEAATLYLQTLVLLDPTKKNVCTWNGWTPKTCAAAAAELVEKGLVLEAKRARAGRDHFLPGGWVETRDILPYEEWKRSLYGWDEAQSQFPLTNPVPLAPLHVLFARGWERCRAGDAPKFQEVRR